MSAKCKLRCAWCRVKSTVLTLITVNQRTVLVCYRHLDKYGKVTEVSTHA